MTGDGRVVGIIGGGPVASMLAQRLTRTGYAVIVGSREPSSKVLSGLRVESLEATVTESDVLINATPGHASVAALTAIGTELFDGKILIDLANAVTPAFDLVYPNSSLAEKLQEALPGAEVVKTMNTAAMSVVTNPPASDQGNMFLSGNALPAKNIATELLIAFGWLRENVIDLGDVRSARGPEHYFAMVPALAQAFGHTNFNISVTSGARG